MALTLLLTGVAMVSPLAAQGIGRRAEHAVAGDIKKIDHVAKTIVIHTADGIDETVTFTEHTTVRGVKGVGHATDMAAKAGLEGGAVVLYVAGEGVDKTAVGITHIGKRTLKVARGTVVRIGDAGKFIIVKTDAGAEETFDLTKQAVVDSGRGIEMVASGIGGAVKQGAEVTLHYSDEGGRKIVHVLKHL